MVLTVGVPGATTRWMRLSCRNGVGTDSNVDERMIIPFIIPPREDTTYVPILHLNNHYHILISLFLL